MFSSWLKLEHLGFGLTFNTVKALSCARVIDPPPCATIIRISIYIPHARMLPSIFSGLPWTAMLQQNVQNLLTGGTLWLPVLALIAGNLILSSSFSKTTRRPQERVFFSLAVDRQLWDLALTVMVGVLVYSQLTLSFVPLNWQKSSHIPPNSQATFQSSRLARVPGYGACLLVRIWAFHRPRRICRLGRFRTPNPEIFLPRYP